MAKITVISYQAKTFFIFFKQIKYWYEFYYIRLKYNLEMSKKIISLVTILILCISVRSQTFNLKMNVVSGDAKVAAAHVNIVTTNGRINADSLGTAVISLQKNKYTIKVSAVGYKQTSINFNLLSDTSLQINMLQDDAVLEDVVITGTMQQVTKAQSAVPVEVYSPKFFAKAAPQSLFEAITQVNGVKPQINCNICNTGDIHINGMEGPYTQILIDGMPIVSGLAGVYGLMGIPLSMIDRVEVIKGPAGSLYGSEAMGGTINIITKNPAKAVKLAIDINASTWGETFVDIGTKIKMGNANGVVGLNWFNYDNPIDNNKDGFTDVTLQKRISLFNKWNVHRKSGKQLSAGARLFYEDRWGGQNNFSKKFRLGDSVYGESIYTKRFETFGVYELPTKEKFLFQWSLALHDQNSAYGTTSYNAQQNIAFAQLYWSKNISLKHNLLAGAALRYTFYDDNSIATYSSALNKNEPQKTFLPGLFVQHEWTVSNKTTLLNGVRVDHDKFHGLVISPRVALKAKVNASTLRFSAGTGFRVVNVFTEDHAALTGARDVVIAESLKPERSLNTIANWFVPAQNNNGKGFIEANIFYSYFSNKIIPDYETDPNKIIYSNLKGHAISRGVGINAEWNTHTSYKINIGFTYMDVYQVLNEAGKKIKQQQLHAPKISGNFTLSKIFVVPQITLDISGNIYGPMRLPLLPNDYRPEYSPTHSIINLQASKKINSFEIYAGIKNLFDFVPANPIMRPFDPFDKNVNDPVNNPNNYTFDPSYNYASLQGIRGYLGIKINID